MTRIMCFRCVLCVWVIPAFRASLKIVFSALHVLLRNRQDPHGDACDDGGGDCDDGNDLIIVMLTIQ